MKLTLHIGHYKTGSTAVQDHFARNRASYRKHGLLYPKTGRAVRSRRCHSAVAFQELHTAERKVARWYAATDEFRAFAAGKRTPLLDAMIQEIATKQPDHVLVSTEEFIRFGGPRGVPQTAAARLVEAFGADEVHILCYLRRPDRYLEAWYNQLIKGGRSPKRLARNLDRLIPTVHVQFADALAYWAQLPNVSRVTVHRYENAADNLIDDVVAAIEAPDLGDLRKSASAADVNPRLPDQFVEFARRANKQLPGGAADRAATLSQLAADSQIGSVPVYFLDLQARQRLLELFRPIDQQLADIAGTGATFFSDLEEMTEIDSGAISDVEALHRWGRIAEDATRDRLAPPQKPMGAGEAVGSTAISPGS
ncbi:MAG: hypothetical protein HKN91_06515 [Acidimicrobiia bacterium]|nr:hypothetical protein [Acidimicrobiia bacterium]